MYTPTIGLEIHAELSTDSKLFCGCKNDSEEKEANLHICPVCLGYPGALPFINKKAIENVLRVGVAMNGEIAKDTWFDRKHYFYPDIPKGYQISQNTNPLVKNAKLAGINVQRIHLEEDTAKSSHDTVEGKSVIDFNRSGIPLMELVTEPVIKSADQAKNFGEVFQTTLKYLGVANARMELGEIRVEVNISVSKTEEFGTKVEIKNLNSFRAVYGAIEYEIKRQTELLDSGGKVVQETRGWNETSEETFSQRKKESSEEYRYMPDPDLPKYDISKISGWDLDSLKNSIPELPEEKMQRYTEELKLSKTQSDILVKNRNIGKIFDEIEKNTKDEEYIKLSANYLTSDIKKYAVEDVLPESINSKGIMELIGLIVEDKISSRGAKDIIEIMVKEGGSPTDIAKSKSLFQESNEEVLKDIVAKLLEKHGDIVEEYRGGKVEVLQFLVGQVMKETKGTANPKKIQEILKENIAK